jgi:hypothetical protein
MKNITKNTFYRNCIDADKGNCPFMKRNEYNVACCKIDNIVQVEYYGCVPNEILLRKAKKL